MENYSELYPLYDGTIFKNYKVKDLLIKSITSKLNVGEKNIRYRIMEFIINNEKPFNINEDYEEIINGKNSEEYKKFTKEEFLKITELLINKQAMVTDEENNVNFIYPVCAMPTNHQVTLEDGRKINAMCAVDAMGTAFTFRQNIKINSSCSVCGEAVEVEIKDGKIIYFSPENLHVLHVDLNKITNWSGCC